MVYNCNWFYCTSELTSSKFLEKLDVYTMEDKKLVYVSGSECGRGSHGLSLAIVYEAQKFHQFTHGRAMHVESDHKPLKYNLSKPLHQAPLRLQKMMLTLQRCDFKVKYLPG